MHHLSQSYRLLPARIVFAASLLAIVSWATPAMHADAADVLIETNFGGDSLHALPSDWALESGRSTPSFSAMFEENEGEAKRSFLRIDHGEQDGRSLVLYAEVDQHDRTSFFQATIEVRGTKSRSLRLAIRTRISPHTYLTNSQVVLNETWERISLEMPNIPAARERIELILELQGPGVFDIANVRLERMNRSDVINELRKETGGGNEQNLLRLTRFPLGFQEGMWVNRDWRDTKAITIEPDPNQVGPSGAPSLKIDSKEPFAIYFPPFEPVLKFDVHRAAFSVRGNGEGRLFVMTEGSTLAEQSFKANSGRWIRVEVRFHPSETSAFHTLRIEGSGTLWLDAFQVSRGDRETRYTAEGEAEVALVLPQGNTSLKRIQLPDEPSMVRYAVTGNLAGKKLLGRLYNLYGEEETLPEILLDNQFLQTGTWKTDLFTDRSLGTFRVEAWVEGKTGDIVSPFYEMVFHRLNPLRSGDEDSPEAGRSDSGRQLLRPDWLGESDAVRNRTEYGFYRHTFSGKETDSVTAVAERAARHSISILSRAMDTFSAGGDLPESSEKMGHLSPGSAALSALSWQMEGAEFNKRISVRDDLIFADLFERDGKILAIISANPESDLEYTPPSDERIEAFDFLNNPLGNGTVPAATFLYLWFEGTVEELEEILKNRYR